MCVSLTDVVTFTHDREVWKVVTTGSNNRFYSLYQPEARVPQDWNVDGQDRRPYPGGTGTSVMYCPGRRVLSHDLGHGFYVYMTYDAARSLRARLGSSLVSVLKCQIPAGTKVLQGWDELGSVWITPVLDVLTEDGEN